MATETRRFSSFYLLILGIFLGFALTSWLAPGALSWYTEPAVPIGVTCSPSVEWALKKIVTLQLIGMAVGGFSLWLLAFVIVRKRTADIKE